MVSLKLQKRLAASVLNCGARKIWMDPNEVRTHLTPDWVLRVRRAAMNLSYRSNTAASFITVD
jgi:hypothetical protein